MNTDKKQKVLVGVLAVLILGAGTTFFFARDSGSGRRKEVPTGPAIKRERAKPAATTKKKVDRGRTKKKRTVERAGPAEKRERKVKESTGSTKREKKRKSERKKKKISEAPAA